MQADWTPTELGESVSMSRNMGLIGQMYERVDKNVTFNDPGAPVQYKYTSIINPLSEEPKWGGETRMALD